MTVRVTKNTAVSVTDTGVADSTRVTKTNAYVTVGRNEDVTLITKATVYVVVGPEIRTVNTTNVIICT